MRTTVGVHAACPTKFRRASTSIHRPAVVPPLRGAGAAPMLLRRRRLSARGGGMAFALPRLLRLRQQLHAVTPCTTPHAGATAPDRMRPLLSRIDRVRRDRCVYAVAGSRLMWAANHARGCTRMAVSARPSERCGCRRHLREVGGVRVDGGDGAAKPMGRVAARVGSAAPSTAARSRAGGCAKTAASWRQSGWHAPRRLPA